MTARKSAATPKAKQASKPKSAPSVTLLSAEGMETATIIEEPRLTLKQERFSQAYVETGNASEAYRKAYDCKDMRPEAINVEASRLQNTPKVALRIEQLRADALKRHQVTVDRIVAEYSKLAFANMSHYMRVNANGLAEVDLSDIDEDRAAAIQEIKVERVRRPGREDSEMQAYVERVTFKLADKRLALDSLSKCLGMFVEKHEVTGKDGKDLVPAIGLSSRDLARAVIDILRESKIEGQADESTIEVALSEAEEIAAAAMRVRSFDP